MCCGQRRLFRNFPSSLVCLTNENVFISTFPLFFILRQVVETTVKFSRKKGVGMNCTDSHPYSTLLTPANWFTIRSKHRGTTKNYVFNVCCKSFSSLFLNVVCEITRSFSAARKFSFSSLRCLPKNWTASRKIFFPLLGQKRENIRKAWFNVLSLVLMPKRREGTCSDILCSRIANFLSCTCHVPTSEHCYCEWMRGLIWGARTGRLSFCSKVNKIKHAESWMNVKPPALKGEEWERENCARINIDRTDAEERMLLPNLQFLAYTRLLSKYWQRCTWFLFSAEVSC